MNSELIDRSELNVPSDENYYEELVQFADDVMNMPTVPAIIIPKNATNGDMFVAVFNPYKVLVWSGQVQVYLTKTKYQMFGIGWWFAPYKKAVEE